MVKPHAITLSEQQKKIQSRKSQACQGLAVFAARFAGNNENHTTKKMQGAIRDVMRYRKNLTEERVQKFDRFAKML